MVRSTRMFELFVKCFCYRPLGLGHEPSSSGSSIATKQRPSSCWRTRKTGGGAGSCLNRKKTSCKKIELLLKFAKSVVDDAQGADQLVDVGIDLCQPLGNDVKLPIHGFA